MLHVLRVPAETLLLLASEKTKTKKISDFEVQNNFAPQSKVQNNL